MKIISYQNNLINHCSNRLDCYKIFRMIEMKNNVYVSNKEFASLPSIFFHKMPKMKCFVYSSSPMTFIVNNKKKCCSILYFIENLMLGFVFLVFEAKTILNVFYINLQANNQESKIRTCFICTICVRHKIVDFTVCVF